MDDVPETSYFNRRQGRERRRGMYVGKMLIAGKKGGQCTRELRLKYI